MPGVGVMAGSTNGEAVVLELVPMCVDRLTPALIHRYKYNHFIPAIYTKRSSEKSGRVLTYYCSAW